MKRVRAGTTAAQLAMLTYPLREVLAGPECGWAEQTDFRSARWPRQIYTQEMVVWASMMQLRATTSKKCSPKPWEYPLKKCPWISVGSSFVSPFTAPPGWRSWTSQSTSSRTNLTRKEQTRRYASTRSASTQDLARS